MAKKLIVIDDSSSARRQVTLALGKAGFDVVEAVDGLDGLKKIEANPDAAGVVCDVNMPNMSGLELLAEVAPRAKAPPFLMLTTEADPEMVRSAKSKGAKGWIMKPFKPELLLIAVKRIVEQAA